MSVDALLARLSGVKKTGRDCWIARCPAHEDGRPSLAVRELEDGRVLVHCFAECATEAVLTAVNLTFDALFPERPIEHGKRERRPFNAADVLACIAAEALIVAVAASNVRQGITLSDTDHQRLHIAAARLNKAVELAHGHG